LIERDHKQRMMGALYEAMFRIRSTVNDNHDSIIALFTQAESEEIQRIATIADATINRLMKIHDAEKGVRE